MIHPDLLKNRHQGVAQLARYFDSGHLHAPLGAVSDECGLLFEHILTLIPADSPELTAGLRKLLEAKDCFVRAAL